MKKNLLKWFFPMLAVLMFGSLIWALLREFNPGTAQVFFSTATGVLSYCIMLSLVLIAVRPKMIEKELGLTEMYEVHGWMAMALPITLLIHVTIRWSGWERILSLDISDTSIWGYVGLLTLFVVMFTGIFVLSDTFIQKSNKLLKLKETYFKRNRHLWLHRLAIVSVIAIHFHLYNVIYIRNNIVFRGLATSYTVIALGWYFIYKIHLARLPKYKIVHIEKPTPTIYKFHLKPENGEMVNYEAGQYAFFRFVDSSVSSEAHPFSLSSAPEHSREVVEVMIKESGDFTNNLDQVEIDDRLTIEGPYGNYYPEEEKKAETPMVLLSGGIGVTPNLSVLRHEIAVNSNRRIAFVWGLDVEDDLMHLDELKEIAETFPNFSYHLIFSGEEVPGYPFGFIDHDFIQKEGLEELYDTANWHVCGPPPMLAAAKGLLTDNNVTDQQTFIEEFAF